MSDIITGLSCPNCSGTLSVHEGQRIVKCPYCDARSLVRGERGVGRYQVVRRIDRDTAAQAVRGFWSGVNKALDLSERAQITELFLAYLPYWSAWAQMAGWVFGQKRVGSGKSSRLEPREVRIREMVKWTGAASDVAEFGVESINLSQAQFAAYNADQLHTEGMVFEPTGAQTQAEEKAHQAWNEQGKSKAALTKVSQIWLRFLRETLTLVYYPLWVARYAYRQRVYQVVVDGSTGKVLYGKAPGNAFYRALMLVGGTALGSFIMVDGLALALAILANVKKPGDAWLLVILPFVVGIPLIATGYRLFRWGEEVEVRVRGEGGGSFAKPWADAKRATSRFMEFLE